MQIHRSLGVSRLVALMAAHRGRSAHERLLGRLDGLVAEARELCARASDAGPDDAPDAAIAAAFQTTLARQTRDWMHRAEAAVRTVRPGADTICGARASELRCLIDNANVAMLRPSDGHASWRAFYRATEEIRSGA